MLKLKEVGGIKFHVVSYGRRAEKLKKPPPAGVFPVGWANDSGGERLAMPASEPKFGSPRVM